MTDTGYILYLVFIATGFYWPVTLLVLIVSRLRNVKPRMSCSIWDPGGRAR